MRVTRRQRHMETFTFILLALLLASDVALLHSLYEHCHALDYSR